MKFLILIVVLVLPNASMELLNIGIEMKNVVSPSRREGHSTLRGTDVSNDLSPPVWA